MENCGGGSPRKSDKCYLCKCVTVPPPSGFSGKTPGNHRTRDHVPPDGIFDDPKPANLITVTSCRSCNASHSEFDDKFRFVLMLEVNANSVAKRLLKKRVFDQENFLKRRAIREVAETVEYKRIPTTHGAKFEPTFKTDRREIESGMVRIVKGLLTHFYQGYDFSDHQFIVLDLNTASLQRRKTGPAELKLAEKIINGAAYDFRGNHGEFQFWRDVREDGGIWFLAFYESSGFVVCHTDKPPISGGRETLR